MRMGQLAKVASKLGKFTKTDIQTEEYSSIKYLHLCIIVCVNVVNCNGEKKLTRTVDVEEQVLQSIEGNLNTIARAFAQRLGVSQSTV